jgi:AcrR family transcriptional regulator
MNEVVVLTPERILEVTEDVLRRYGLAKATVVDVARALDVSHGSVYRHFPSKASLREAVAKRWLDRLSAPLLKIAEASGPAPARLDKWLRTMFSIKHKRLGDDPEMFATYLTLAREACKSVNCHKDCLVDQIALILSDGVKQGTFEVADVKVSARAIFASTIPRTPKSGTNRVPRRGSMRCWRCCLRDWKRRASGETILLKPSCKLKHAFSGRMRGSLADDGCAAEADQRTD